MARVRQNQPKNQRQTARQARDVAQPLPLDDDIATTPVTLAMIQALIPLVLKVAEDALLAEVIAVAGLRPRKRTGRRRAVGRTTRVDRFRRSEAAHHGAVSPRSACTVRSPLGDLCRVPDAVRRRRPSLRRVLGGLSSRDYVAAADAVP